MNPRQPKEAAPNGSVTFGNILTFHLRHNGTRPTGRPGQTGKAWTYAEFAVAAGTTERSVRNWLNDEALPGDIHAVERALFGDNPAYDPWRLQLRRAHHPLEGRPFENVRRLVIPFVGRHSELERMHDELTADRAIRSGASACLLLRGMAGVGKSLLAARYAREYRDEYGGVYWCDAETPTSLATALSGLATILGASRDQTENLVQGAKAGLRLLDSQAIPWLLIYDNASSPIDLKEFLPERGANLLLISRHSSWSQWAPELLVGLPDLEDARQMLQLAAGWSDEEGSYTLVQAVDRLPLALSHAAATCREMRLKFAEYAAQVEDRMRREIPEDDYPRCVFVTFSLAIDAVSTAATKAHYDPALAERLMAYLSLCSPDRIPKELMQGAFDDLNDAEAASMLLSRFSLVEYGEVLEASSAVTVHRLVQAVARSRALQNGFAQEMFDRLVVRLNDLFPHTAYGETGSWPLCAQLAPHVLALLEPDRQAFFKPPAWPFLLDSAASYFSGRGDFVLAEALLRRSIAILERHLEQDEWSLSSNYANLARLLLDKGELAEAELLFERARVLHSKEHGDDHIFSSDMLRALANIESRRGNGEEARKLFARALAICEASPEADAVNKVAMLNDYASFLLDDDDVAAAQKMFEQARDLNQLDGIEDRQTGGILHHLAYIAFKRGDLDSAEALYRKALASCEKVLGQDHPVTAVTLHAYGEFCSVRGDHVQAQSLLERAFGVRIRVFGWAHPITYETVAALEACYFTMGEPDQAVDMFKYALEHFEKENGSEDPAVNCIRADLGRVLLASGRRSEALDPLKLALSFHEQALGSDHPWTKQSARLNFEVLNALGHTAEAEALRARAGL